MTLTSGVSKVSLCLANQQDKMRRGAVVMGFDAGTMREQLHSTAEPGRANDRAPDTHLDRRWLSLRTIVAHSQPTHNATRRTQRSA